MTDTKSSDKDEMFFDNGKALFKITYKESKIKELIKAYDVILAHKEKEYNHIYHERQILMDREYQHGR